MDRQKEHGIAFGEAVLMSSPPSRSQMDDRLESGFGGRADEKIQTAREAPPLLGRKKSYPQHLTIALNYFWFCSWKSCHFTIPFNKKLHFFFPAGLRGTCLVFFFYIVINCFWFAL